ncbi:hypothetical protein D9M73_134400 [compost metagenome]
MGRRIDVERLLQRIVRDDCGRWLTVERAESAEDLIGTGARSGDWEVLEVRQRARAILRRLHDNWVGHPVFGVEPESGRDLRAAREVDGEAARHVILGDPEAIGLRAVDVEAEFGGGLGLLHADVGDAGDVAHPLGEQMRIGFAMLAVAASHHHVYWGGRAEVEDLADDVGGQEREHRTGKGVGQGCAQPPDIVSSRCVILGERDQDVAVL